MAAGTWLYGDEVGNNTIISIAKRAGSSSSMLRPPYLFSVATQDDRVVGCTAFANPDGLVLSEMTNDCCQAIVRSVVAQGIRPTRLYAPVEIAENSAKDVSECTGSKLREKGRWRAYWIDESIKVTNERSGQLRVAGESDQEIVRSLGAQYNAENPSLVDVERYFELKRQSSDLHIWCSAGDSSVLSVVAIAGQTTSVARIAAVFTPIEHRGQGFASAAVTAITNAKLYEGYRSVTLVCDLKDSSTRRMYENLGYRKVGDFVEMHRHQTEGYSSAAM